VGADQLLESCEKSFNNELRRRGVGGMKGWEEGEGEGDGGREQYNFSEEISGPR
jgi:hypothetical protein